MKTRAIEQPGGMVLRSHRLRDQGEVRIHRLRADFLDDDRYAGIPLGAERAEQPGRLEAAMHERPRAAAFLGPASDHFAFLADPGFVLHPNLNLRGLGMVLGDLCQAFGKPLLERGLRGWIRLVVLRPAHQLLQAHGMQLGAHRFGAHADAPGALDQRDNVANSELGPSVLPILRSGQHHPLQFGSLLRGERGGTSGDLAIPQTGNSLGVVPLHRPRQVPRGQTNHFRRLLAAAPGQDVGNSQAGEEPLCPPSRSAPASADPVRRCPASPGSWPVSPPQTSA